MTTAGIHFKPAKILVPTDFSASAEFALETATDLAEHFGANLHLLNVIPAFPITTGVEFPTPFYPWEKVFEESQKRAEQILLGNTTALVSRGLQARSSVEVGDDVVGNILRIIERELVDMVVISTHGISGWRPMIFGSTAEKVVRLVECPLLLLRSVKPTSAPLGLHH